MMKTKSMHLVPDRKNSFKFWVNKIRSPSSSKIKESDLTLKKSVYIYKSRKKPNKWNNIQINSRKRYNDKIKLMEEIRQRKIENKTGELIYTPRYLYSPSFSK